MKKIIDKYNTVDSLIVISLYPKKGELYSAGTSGVASYTKNILLNLKRKTIVLANHIGKQCVYEEDETLIVRCFKTNRISLWLNLFKKIRQFNAVKHILIQFDFAAYGGIIPSSFILPFLAVLKLFGYKTSIVVHHVVLDVNKLSGHVGLKNNIPDRIKGIVYNILFYIFYKTLGLVATQIIVLEETLKDKLSTLIPDSKIIAIPHGVDTDSEIMSKSQARKILRIARTKHVVLFFGFVNWFKGADFFVETFKNTTHLLGKKSRFIIAGGISPTLKNQHYYQNYFKKVVNQIDKSSNIDITGYVPQAKINVYFAASDLVVFPYRHFMTASGVLSLVFSYKKPFIVSDELAQMFDAPDFKDAFAISGLKKNEFVFKLNKQSCLLKTKAVLKNGSKKKMIKMTEIIREIRSYKNTAKLYELAIFNAKSYQLGKRFAFSYRK